MCHAAAFKFRCCLTGEKHFVVSESGDIMCERIAGMSAIARKYLPLAFFSPKATCPLSVLVALKYYKNNSHFSFFTAANQYPLVRTGDKAEYDRLGHHCVYAEMFDTNQYMKIVPLIEGKHTYLNILLLLWFYLNHADKNEEKDPNILVPLPNSIPNFQSSPIAHIFQDSLFSFS